MVVSVSFKYVLTIFPSGLDKNRWSINHDFFALFFKFSVPLCFFPDGMNVNPRYVYCFTTSITCPTNQSWHFLIVARCFLKIIIFVLLRFNSNLYSLQIIVLILIFFLPIPTLTMKKLLNPLQYEFKGYLRYKTILCHRAALDIELMIFLFEEKIMFLSRDTEIFVFWWNLQISKFVTSSQVLLHNASYTYAIKMNEIWSNTSVLYDKHFWHVFGWMLETGN